MNADRAARGARAHRDGLSAEDLACAALMQSGWTILARRLRTEAGEIDVIADLAGLLAIIEVKQRPTLADAAYAVSKRQQGRLIAAAGAVLAKHPDWGAAGVRFDVIMVDAAGTVRRITDAFRAEI